MEQEKKKQPELSGLVRRAQAGDRAAMEALYLETYPALWRTVRAISNSDADALDLLQESYLLAFTHLGELRKPERFLPWLKRIAVNELRQQLRKKQPLLFADLSRASDAPPADAETPERILERQEDAAALRQLMDALPDGQRAILILYYCEQYSVREIAEQLGVTRGTVKAQLYHGRRKLEKALKGSAASLSGALSLLFLSQLPPAKKAVPAAVLEQLPQHAVALTAKSARAVLLSRVAIGVAAAAAVGGLAFGAARLLGSARRQGDFRPPTEIGPLPSDVERIAAPSEEASETQAPLPVETPADLSDALPTEPTAPPTEAPTVPPTEAPADPPAATQSAEPAPATPGDLPDESPELPGEADAAPAGAGDLAETTPGTLPTENPCPFRYQEVSVPVGKTWVGSFPTDREWAVTVFAHTLNISTTSNTWTSSCSDGLQIVTFYLKEPGVFTFSLCADPDTDAWVRWVKITVVPAD